LDWKRNPKRILQVCDQVNSDILILQEVDKRLGARSGVFDAEYLNHVDGLPAGLNEDLKNEMRLKMLKLLYS